MKETTTVPSDSPTEPALTGAALQPNGPAPAVISPPTPGTDIAAWARDSRESIDRLVDRHKALLFRGFAVESVGGFQEFLAALGTDLLEYSERSTPRSTVDGKVYTSTEYESSAEIPMHNENSYSAKWPRRILFCCLLPAQKGGATPIADSRAVFDEIDEDVRKRFLHKQVMYVRNFGLGVDLSWQDAFQTQDRERVEAYCRSSDIDFEWFSNGKCLRTRQVRPAAISYDPTGERIWFNQAHLFHVSSLEATIRRSLTAVFPQESLPRNACYGDGTPIEDEALDEVRRAYLRLRTPIDWEQGDILLLDNVFFAHGRLPFSGDRRVVVAMDGDGRPGTSPL